MLFCSSGQEYKILGRDQFKTVNNIPHGFISFHFILNVSQDNYIDIVLVTKQANTLCVMFI